jgi:hypothetical protein
MILMENKVMTSTINAAEMQKRLDAVKALQTKSNGNGANAQGTAVYEYLKVHGRIASNNPLLATLNPKYPTDAAWTNCAVKMREQLAADGYCIVSTGRKPTTYTLTVIPGCTPAFAIGAVPKPATTASATASK